MPDFINISSLEPKASKEEIIRSYHAFLKSGFTPTGENKLLKYLYIGTSLRNLNNFYFAFINQYLQLMEDKSITEQVTSIWLLIFLLHDQDLNNTAIKYSNIKETFASKGISSLISDDNLLLWLHDLEILFKEDNELDYLFNPEKFMDLVDTSTLVASLSPTDMNNPASNSPNLSDIPKKLIFYFNGLFQFSSLYYLEKNLEHEIDTRVALPSLFSLDLIEKLNLKSALNLLFTNAQDTTDKQLISVLLSLGKHLSFIFGGPGTGKTTTVKKLIYLNILLFKALYNRTPNLVMCAPTGKAAQRLTESVNKGLDELFKDMSDLQNPANISLGAAEKKIMEEPAYTIHKILGISSFNPLGRYNKKNTLPYDIIVVDEVSMIDIFFMNKLMESTSPESIIIFLGDKEQLPSVGIGSFVDGIYRKKLVNNLDIGYSAESKKILESFALYLADNNFTGNTISDSIHILTKSHRFKTDSGIAEFANCVKNDGHLGKYLFSIYTETVDLNSANDVNFIPYPELSDFKLENYIIDLLNTSYQEYITLVNARAPITECFAAFKKVCFLCPQRKGILGTENLNAKVLENWQANNKNFTNEFVVPGLAIMITQNDYNLNLFNGDIGLYLYDELQQDYRIFFEQNNHAPKSFALSLLNKYETAFFITIHKSQGDEYDNCFILCPKRITNFHSKPMFYTAITRAKKKVFFLGDKELFKIDKFSDLYRFCAFYY